MKVFTLPRVMWTLCLLSFFLPFNLSLSLSLSISLFLKSCNSVIQQEAKVCLSSRSIPSHLLRHSYILFHSPISCRYLRFLLLLPPFAIIIISSIICLFISALIITPLMIVMRRKETNGIRTAKCLIFALPVFLLSLSLFPSFCS